MIIKEATIRIIACAWLMAAVLMICPALAEPVVKSGDSAPAIKLQNTRGETVTINPSSGNKVTLLCFFTSWSKPCQEEMAFLQTLTGEKVTIYGVSFDRKLKDLKEYLAAGKIDFEIVHDAKLKTIKDFGVIILPSLFVIDRQGKITNIYIDYDENVKEAVTNELKTLTSPSKE
ncbi:MAG: TlpA disulfide reductase family protein [Candidatus Margulisiibacteriota bacterium]